jgi:hypothetical protein
MKVDFVAGTLPFAEKLGWKVLLLEPQWKRPFLSKREGGNGVHDASSDPGQIRAWGRACPNGNIGIACGEASGIVVLDVDPRNGGDVAIRALAAKGHVFPKGPRARTGNGGFHLLYRHQPGIGGSKNKLGRGIDVKSTGGYIVVAPSWTRGSDAGPGGSYVWEVSPFAMPVPRLPIWLSTMLNPPPRRQAAYTPEAAADDLEGLIRFVSTSQAGERNSRLYWAACRAREQVERRTVSEASAMARLTAAATAIGLPALEAQRTIASGFRGAGE